MGSCQGVPGAAAGQLTAALLVGTRSRMAEMAQVTWPFFSLLLQMEKKPQDIKTLPHRGVRQAERIQLPALPPLPRQAATQAAAPKQVPAAQASSPERATCKLPPLQAAASASSGGGRAKSLGTEARSQQELLPPLPCISGNRDRAVRAERRERGPHSPVAPDEDVGNAIRSFVSTVITNALACNEGASSKAANAMLQAGTACRCQAAKPNVRPPRRRQLPEAAGRFQKQRQQPAQGQPRVQEPLLGSGLRGRRLPLQGIRQTQSPKPTPRVLHPQLS